MDIKEATKVLKILSRKINMATNITQEQNNQLEERVKNLESLVSILIKGLPFTNSSEDPKYGRSVIKAYADEIKYHEQQLKIIKGMTKGLKDD